ncbi:MAG: YeeE/YedE family protein [Gammaproteobacteria bacterium]|nr:YeeE/YedE family protein [Gammaproteobacteria bacterium]MBU1602308.1 YeeE/YedE family protein [Gammaproteobacteria bacterium]MBU2433114.1 YeeE/YedE family protein [Gammaproteobacteria bacterium]MBU2451028.1 YeeE/YedE family protein [Gammaproteobacteria bacterium]
MFPLNDGGVISGLVCGILFGFVLERAGFGSPCKLTAQFRFNDWSVFKVMFTAITVSAVGLYLLRLTGLMAADSVFVPTSLLMAAAIGGALVGAGFAIGGYCPGTSIVGLFSGRLDALVFIVGLLLGTVVFAGLYGPTVEAIMAMAEVETGDTLVDAYEFSEPVVLACILVALAGVFALGSWFERRSAEGPVSAEQAVNGAPGEQQA